MAYTTIDKPTDYFTSFLWTGDGSTSPRSHTGVGLQADMMWSKVRSAGHQHNLVDTVRGVNQRLLMPSDNGDEDTTCTHGHFDSLDSDGFTTTNAGGNWNVNASGNTYVGWFWKAGGSASSNSNGTITSSVSANTTSGFSVATWTGTGSNGSVGHGLGGVDFMIIKDRDNNRNWYTWNKTFAYNDRIKLDTNSAKETGTDNMTALPDSTKINMATSTQNNGSSIDYVGYFFQEKKGYSKFGSYKGNGNADGTFVYTGFKTAWLLVKKSSGTGDWFLIDNKRSTINPTNHQLEANSSAAEDASGRFDFLSNGFKCVSSSTGSNGSGTTYIYMAFAESPFVTSTGIPTTAR